MVSPFLRKLCTTLGSSALPVANDDDARLQVRVGLHVQAPFLCISRRRQTALLAAQHADDPSLHVRLGLHVSFAFLF
jgi:hypothetical protein